MDFEKVFTILVFFGGMVGITLALTAGIVNLRRRAARDRLELDQGGVGGREELEELRARVEDLERRGLVSGEVESQYARLAELEERLDFAERLLAQRQEPARLPPEGLSS
jgi:hypothetical protein